MMLWTKIDTTMEDKLHEDFDFSPETCALAYTIQFIGFLCVSPFCHKIMHMVDNTLLISISQIVQGLASWLIGPSYLFRSFLPNSIYVIFGGLFLTGLANTFTTIATYQEMHDPYIEQYGVETSEESEKLSDILSGLYNAGFSTGVIIGPFAASYITLSLGYRP
jgi:MFS family permease